MARRSKNERRYDRELFFSGMGVIVSAIVIITVVPLVPAIGPFEREAYLFICSIALVGTGWLLGAREADRG